MYCLSSAMQDWSNEARAFTVRMRNCGRSNSHVSFCFRCLSALTLDKSSTTCNAFFCLRCSCASAALASNLFVSTLWDTSCHSCSMMRFARSPTVSPPSSPEPRIAAMLRSSSAGSSSPGVLEAALAAFRPGFRTHLKKVLPAESSSSAQAGGPGDLRKSCAQCSLASSSSAVAVVTVTTLLTSTMSPACSEPTICATSRGAARKLWRSVTQGSI
mmetsp:Transcript_154336/g.287808  ORF Transcript_154336/g.287808 Transcript_154336/m.287808 type:complete len:215 (+) Transcript_154336:256-900(+)